MEIIYLVICAFLLDLLLGDPLNWPHPVIYMGKYIDFFISIVEDKKYTARMKKFLGLVLVISLIMISVLLVYLIIKISNLVSIKIKYLIEIYIIYSCFSVRSLADAAYKVRRSLDNDPIEMSRKQVGMIVGRETTYLEKTEIIKATIETVSENTSDGFIAPLFFVLLFGVYGGIMYKAINTLDSMVGYIQEPYKDIGYFSAKIDDIANYIPARISWFLLTLSSMILRYDWFSAIKIGYRDAREHRSPNAGYPESAVAGALNIQLGGEHRYHGKQLIKPTIGDDNRHVVVSDINRVIYLLYCSSVLGVFIGVLSIYMINY